jgi:hypothetical protein
MVEGRHPLEYWSAVELKRRDAEEQDQRCVHGWVMAMFVPRNAPQRGFLSSNAPLDQNRPTTVGVSSSEVMPLYFLTAEERDKFTTSKATLRLPTSVLITTDDFIKAAERVYARFSTTNMTYDSWFVPTTD